MAVRTWVERSRPRLAARLLVRLGLGQLQRLSLKKKLVMLPGLELAA